MQDPIPIKRDMPEEEPLLSAEERAMLDKERFNRRVQTGFLVFLGIVVAGFLTPLVIFLVRLSLGG